MEFFLYSASSEEILQTSHPSLLIIRSTPNNVRYPISIKSLIYPSKKLLQTCLNIRHTRHSPFSNRIEPNACSVSFLMKGFLRTYAAY